MQATPVFANPWLYIEKRPRCSSILFLPQEQLLYILLEALLDPGHMVMSPMLSY